MKKLLCVFALMMACFIMGTTTSYINAGAKVSVSSVRKQCSTKSKALKYMTKVNIKVWDLSRGKKVTRTKTIVVNKAIASNVKKAFQKIYNGKEKFPIHEISGFDWRGSTKSLHSIGLAIDINWSENYMVVGSQVLCGELWKPGKNPYSIPKKGDVQKALRKYGLKQCIWGSRKDYMHFSIGGL